MSPALMELLLARKLQRVAAYRELQWQALSSLLWHITSRSMDDFAIPDGVLWKPVGFEKSELGTLRTYPALGHVFTMQRQGHSAGCYLMRRIRGSGRS